MKRVCFIGSSHVGAVKLGADALKEKGALEDIDVRIFGSHKNSLASCLVKKGKVTSNRKGILKNFEWTSGGFSEVIIKDYDVVYVVAGTSLFSIQPYLTINAMIDLCDLPPISESLFESINAKITGSFAVGLAQNIATEYAGTKVVHVGAPLMSDESPVANAITTNMGNSEDGISDRISALKNKLSQRAKNLATENFSFMHPPKPALEKHNLFTKAKYCRESVRLDPSWDLKHGVNDFVHMNGAYGEALIKNLLRLK